VAQAPVADLDGSIEINEVQRAPLIEQDVAWLQVKVQDTAAMDMSQSICQLD
jgi:hypothetical protein